MSGYPPRGGQQPLYDSAYPQQQQQYQQPPYDQYSHQPYDPYVGQQQQHQPPYDPYGGQQQQAPYGYASQQPYNSYHDPYAPPQPPFHPQYSSDTLVPPTPPPLGDGTQMSRLQPRGRPGDDYPGSAQSTPLIKPQAYYDDVPADMPLRDAPSPSPYIAPYVEKSSRKRRTWFFVVLAVVALAAAGVCVYFFVIRPRQNHASGGSSGPGKSNSNSTDTKPTVAKLVVGYNGASVTAEDGSEFVYTNPFGGFFIDDPNDPFNNGAKAQEWSPALNETWDYATDIIRGVNLGGWLVLEPFIAPALYDKYKDTAPLNGDEWTLVEAMRADTSPDGGIKQLENHYATFITEKDFADIAGAGLNWVRLPIPYWAIEVWQGEPFLEKTAWTYALKAFKWARKYGIRVNLDLHTLPGSQNGWNHSGKVGNKNWMNGVMGYANAQRSLTYLRIITEFISQKEYKDVIPIFGIVNEPTVGKDYLDQFYLEAYNTIRGVTGLGAGNGPFISIHDNFNTGAWGGFLKGADRLALDAHRYYAFDGQNKPDIATFIDRPCLDFGNAMNGSMKNFGFTAGGEWSLGYNDCGRYVNDGLEDKHSTKNCATFWDLYLQYPAQTKQDLYNFALASMEGMRNFFFWTWKIGPTGRGLIEAPLWSYQLGLEQGWLPKDPREAQGHCAARGVAFDPNMAVGPTLAPSATGGAGAPATLDPAATAGIRAWPPTQLDQVVGGPLPSYTPTGPIPTLPPPTLTPMPSGLDGWTYDSDVEGAMVPIAGCQYPDPWGDPAAPVPAACPS